MPDQDDIPKTGEAPAPEAAPEVREPEAFVSAPEAEESKAVHGFFDEEDDETIALTGDELDNILSTAEISEGEEDGVSLDEDLLSLDPEGNLVVPEAPAAEVPAPESEEVHVTDEEFLAGTGLEVEPSTEAYTYEEADLGIPESIELEETLP